MSDAAYQDEAERFAAALLLQAAWPVALVALAVFAAPAFAGTRLAAALVATAGGFVTIALSALLTFDALLFRLMASHRDETTGGVAVDDVLVRMRLKPAPRTTRTLAERIAGTRRILAWQRAAFVVFAGACAFLIVGR